MAILTKAAILEAVEAGDITIDPFDPAKLNPNSVDVTLGPELLVYDAANGYFDMTDRRFHPAAGGARPTPLRIDGDFVLRPGLLCIAHTVERTYTPKHVPKIEGKSSIGRMGLFVHVTAGYGDTSFDGQWTLELVATVPIVLRAGLPIAQVSFHTIEGEPTAYSGRYQGSRGVVAARA
jgi:dCTP deaminase